MMFIDLEIIMHMWTRGRQPFFFWSSFLTTAMELRVPYLCGLSTLKEVFIDSNNIILLHELEDINKKSLFPKFQLVRILRFQDMHDYVCFIVPIDYCVE